MDSLSLKSTFLKNYFRNSVRVSDILDPDQARHIVGPNLGPNCLQRLSAEDTSRQSIIHLCTCMQHMYHVGLQVYRAVAQLV